MHSPILIVCTNTLLIVFHASTSYYDTNILYKKQPIILCLAMTTASTRSKPPQGTITYYSH